MNIQSLSICVPTKKCINNCKFCVSKMHTNDYKSLWDKDKILAKNEFKKRLLFAKDNGCNTIILTGIGECLQNKNFLKEFSDINVNMNNPFYWIELQTSGVMLTDNNLDFLQNIGVNTISLSVSDLFDDRENLNIIEVNKKLLFNIEELCLRIKNYNFNLRLSLNMTKSFNDKTPEQIFDRLKNLGVDQVTFRILYKSNNNCEQNIWIENNSAKQDIITDIYKYIELNGKKLEVLPFGAIRYSVNEISTVIDDDCMNVVSKDVVKYLILRENAKLYTRWDDKGSLVF